MGIMSNQIVLAARRAQDRGDLDAAKRLYRQALAADPLSLQAARQLALIYENEGNPGETIPLLSPIVRVNPHHHDALLQLGRCLLFTNQVKAAVDLLQHAVSISPRTAETRVWLGEALLTAHRPHAAMDVLAPVLSDHRARALMGRLCMILGRQTEGVEHFRMAVAANPEPRRRCELGWALESSGKMDAALEQFEAALMQEPGRPQALAGRAVVLKSKGRADEARAILERVLDKPTSEVALTYARLARTPEEQKLAIAAIDRALATPSTTGTPFATLLCSKGNLLEGLGQFDAAFEAYHAANESQPRTYDAVGHERATRAIIGTFSAEKMARYPRVPTADPLPVFIVGMPRSGTSLVEQILSSHPAVHGAGELENLGRLLAQIPSVTGLADQFPECVASMTRSQLEGMAGEYLRALRDAGPGAARVTDKMPNNFTFLGMIDLLFPGAKVIHCTRDPVDTCLSCYTTPLHHGHTYRQRLTDLAAAYGAYRRLMDHWRTVVRVPMMDVSYESLVADPEPSVRRLVEFVGLPWNDKCLRPHENPRHVVTASVDQVRRPIYHTSVQRWRRYERHLSVLVQALKPWC